MKQYYVYFITNWNNKTLYIGVTNNLECRLYEHKQKLIPGFSMRYNLNKLVYFEIFDDPENAIQREKYLKGKTRKKKNALVEKENPNWQDLSNEWHIDSSATPQNDTMLNCHPEGAQHPEGSKTPKNQTMNRYIRQLALPEIDLIKQEHLSQTHILMVGAGGLGSAALPYLASAGIGHITIADHDDIDITNLHRQTIYKTSETGQNKAEAAAEHLRALNPDIKVTAISERIKSSSPQILESSYDLILDGSDNFETKALLNDISIQTQTPLISASVNGWQGQIGIYEGYKEDAACYRCIFPEFPTDARNCNEAGILGTSAGIIGMMQAHVALLKLLYISPPSLHGTSVQSMDHTHEACNDERNSFLSINLKTLRISNISTHKEPNCQHCNTSLRAPAKQSRNIDCRVAPAPRNDALEKEAQMPDLISKDDLTNHIIIDVRQPEELETDPLPLEALHIPLPELIARQIEIPKDQPTAFVCAGNVRSRQAAEYLAAKGYTTVYVLDKFSL